MEFHDPHVDHRENATVLDLSPKLKGAPFDVLLVMMTPQVTGLTPAYKLLTILADSNLDMPHWTAPLIADVCVRKLCAAFKTRSSSYYAGSKCTAVSLFKEATAVAADPKT